MTQPQEPLFTAREEKPLTAHLLATPQLLHGRFSQTYERILGALNAADANRLTMGELEALGEKGKVFFGEEFTPVQPKGRRNSRKKRPNRERAGEAGANGNFGGGGEGGPVNGQGIEVTDYEQLNAGQANDSSQYSDLRKLNRSLSIYVRGIDDLMTAEGLKDAFCAFGVVNAVDVVYNRHCAYIEFNTKEDCERAIEANEVLVGESRVYAEARRPPSFRSRGYFRGRRYPQRGDNQTGWYTRGGYRGGRGYRGYRNGGRDGGDQNDNGEVEGTQYTNNQRDDNQHDNNPHDSSQNDGDHQDNLQEGGHETTNQEGNE